MIAYKLKEASNGIEKDRMFYVLDTQVLLIATFTEPHRFTDTWSFNRLKEKGLLEEVDLLREVKIHPHLYKPIKELINNKKQL